MKIANIVIQSKKHDFGNEFNVVSDCSEIINGIPTLIVGYNEAKKCIDNFNILNKSYDNGNVWWTYKKNERRCDYDDDVVDFIDFSVKKLKKSIRYEYIDLANYKFERVKKLIRYLYSPERKKIMVSKNKLFVFIYSEKYKVVFGLSLSYCEYIGIKREKIISKLKSNKSNKFVHDFSNIDSRIRNSIGSDTHCTIAFL